MGNAASCEAAPAVEVEVEEEAVRNVGGERRRKKKREGTSPGGGACVRVPPLSLASGGRGAPPRAPRLPPGRVGRAPGLPCPARRLRAWAWVARNLP